MFLRAKREDTFKVPVVAFLLVFACFERRRGAVVKGSLAHILTHSLIHEVISLTYSWSHLPHSFIQFNFFTRLLSRSLTYAHWNSHSLTHIHSFFHTRSPTHTHPYAHSNSHSVNHIHSFIHPSTFSHTPTCAHNSPSLTPSHPLTHPFTFLHFFIDSLIRSLRLSLIDSHSLSLTHSLTGTKIHSLAHQHAHWSLSHTHARAPPDHRTPVWLSITQTACWEWQWKFSLYTEPLTIWPTNRLINPLFKRHATFCLCSCSRLFLPHGRTDCLRG